MERDELIQTYLYIRPYSKEEKTYHNSDEPSAFALNETQTAIKFYCPKQMNETPRNFSFRRVYDFRQSVNQQQQHMQNDLFEHIGSNNAMEDLFSGNNASIIAFGQTFTGKTSTLYGKNGRKGLISEVCEGICSRIKIENSKKKAKIHYSIGVSIYEVKDNKIFDILNPGADGTCKALRTVFYHPKFGTYIHNLTQVNVVSFKDIEEILRLKRLGRAIAFAKSNQMTSSSSVIFSLKLLMEDDRKGQTSIISMNTLNIVDLAGSEKIFDVDYPVDKETSNFGINTLIASVRELIALDNRDIPPEIFKQSTLTKVLKDTIGGNSKAYFISFVNPSIASYEDNLFTLRFSSLFAQVQNRHKSEKITLNEVAEDLFSEIKQLKHTTGPSGENKVLIANELQLLMDYLKIVINKKQYSKLSNVFRSWNSNLSSMGTSICSDPPASPYLMKYCEDADISGQLYYSISFLRSDVLTAGKIIKSDEEFMKSTIPNILLFGTGIENVTCMFQPDEESENDVCIFVPNDESFVFLNGQKVEGFIPHKLRHEDRLVLGIQNIFSYFVPGRTFSICDESNSSLIDWEYIVGEMLSLHEIHDLHTQALSNCDEAVSKTLNRVASLTMLYAEFPDHIQENNYVGDVKKGVLEECKGIVINSEKIVNSTMSKQLEIVRQSLRKAPSILLFTFVIEANFLCKEINVFIQYVVSPVITHAVEKDVEDGVEISKLDSSLNVNAISLQDNSSIATFTAAEFVEKIIQMRSIYKRFLEESEEEFSLSVQENDIFYPECVEVSLGIATFYLNGLNYLLTLDESVPIIDQSGKITGTIHVEVVPCLPLKESKKHKDTKKFKFTPCVHKNLDTEEEKLIDYLGEQLEIRIKIIEAENIPLRSNSNVNIKYQFYFEEEVNSTSRSMVKTRHPRFNEEFRHQVVIDHELIKFVNSESIEFEVFGSTGKQSFYDAHKRIAKEKEMYWLKLENYESNKLIESLSAQLGTMKKAFASEIYKLPIPTLQGSCRSTTAPTTPLPRQQETVQDKQAQQIQKLEEQLAAYQQPKRMDDKKSASKTCLIQ